jgi:hypothetical protein
VIDNQQEGESSVAVVVIARADGQINALVTAPDGTRAVTIQVLDPPGRAWRLNCECGCRVYLPGADLFQLCPHIIAIGRAEGSTIAYPIDGDRP